MWPYTIEENDTISKTNIAHHREQLLAAIRKGYTAYKQDKYSLLGLCVVPSIMLTALITTLFIVK